MDELNFIIGLIREFGPVTTLGVLVLLDRLGVFAKLRKPKEGPITEQLEKEALTLETLKNNHIAHLEEDIVEIREAIAKLPTRGEIKEELKEVRREMEKDKDDTIKYVDDRIKSVYKSIEKK